MPVMDGITATKAIRNLSQKSIRSTPIIAFTASVLSSDVKEWYAAGANAILPKPFTIDQLTATVYKIFAPKIPLQKTPQTGPNSLSRITEFCMGNKEKSAQMYQNILNSLNKSILHLEEALKIENKKTLQRIFHDLQTIFYYLNEDLLGKNIKDLEFALKVGTIEFKEIRRKITPLLKQLKSKTF